MDIFKEVKECLTPQQVAETYLGNGKKSGSNILYKSPFREEKTASFCVNNSKGFHDYGTGWHGDIIKFAQELFNITPIEAVKMLIKDFSLQIPIGRANKSEVRQQRKKSISNSQAIELLEKWFNETFIKLCNENRVNEISIKIIQKQLKSIDDFRQESLMEALQYLYNKQVLLEFWIDEFINAKNSDDKLELFRCREEVNKICL